MICHSRKPSYLRTTPRMPVARACSQPCRPCFHTPTALLASHACLRRGTALHRSALHLLPPSLAPVSPRYLVGTHTSGSYPPPCQAGLFTQPWYLLSYLGALQLSTLPSARSTFSATALPRCAPHRFLQHAVGFPFRGAAPLLCRLPQGRGQAL